MALYNLVAEKSTVVLQTNENVPDGVQYIQYRDKFFERDATPRADGTPDPYLWKEAKELAEGAVVVNGKDLISTMNMTQTQSGVQVNHTSQAAAEAAAAAAAQAATAAVQEQLSALNERAVAAEKELADLKAQLAAAGIEITPETT